MTNWLKALTERALDGSDRHSIGGFPGTFVLARILMGFLMFCEVQTHLLYSRHYCDSCAPYKNRIC